LKGFTPDDLAPHFERVESTIGVEPAKWDYLSGCARVVKRGCDALGYSQHGPLPRNAPDCDGQGLCVFGCPTDAKRSTNVSYVPLALQNHATLFYRARVKKLLIENGRARGVVAESVARRRQEPVKRRLTIRAKAVVVSCGTYGTPTLLMKNGLEGSSGQLGQNLSLHPAVGVVAELDERLDGWNAIPQGYSVWALHNQGLMLEGGFMPLSTTTTMFGFVGPAFTRLMERYNHLAMFGVMVEDTSRGRVRLNRRGQPLVTYNLNGADLAALKRGIEVLSEIFFAAGALKVLPPVHGHEQLAGLPDLERFRRARIRPMDLSLSAYHPLGTARLGVSRRSSVVGSDHQVFDVPGLYIVDGSSVPSSLGVNPQLTIMALATRAAGMLAARLV
jgi:choline dehydrogenase-like flavoprotein